MRSSLIVLKCIEKKKSKMRLNILAEDSRLKSGTQCCLIATINYDEDIPWTIIHQAERFLRLKIIVCEDCGTEHFIKETVQDYDAVKKPLYEEIMRYFQTVNCSTQSSFLDVLRSSITEYFGDSLTPDQVDAVFIRSS